MISTDAIKAFTVALGIMFPLAAEAASANEKPLVIAQATGSRTAPAAGAAATGRATPAPTAPAQPPTVANTEGVTGTEAPQPNPYCEAVVDVAADARFAWQAKTLEAMRLDLEDRAAKLEEKRAETELWLKRRQEFLDRTEGRIVSIYSRMRADAAAAQIAAMQDDAAVALLSKIDARAASAIFNEMEPGRAAHLTSVITGVLKRTAQTKARPK
ncbi:MotE family protein [Pseudochelatococcus sp. G4_1912]|uniref:MotE family protein n=1 Tax=Pseudochelatococcus sp. G4_1912 TaxID=3114288 RepID=UPI0039C6E264